VPADGGGSDAVVATSDGAPQSNGVTDAGLLGVSPDAAADAPDGGAACVQCNDAGCFPCFV
jgi:hypothetical protein